MFELPKGKHIKAAMRHKGYMVFAGNKGDDINLFGVRTQNVASNTFNDVIGVLYMHGGEWLVYAFPATTDPGLYWRENPMNVNGTAMLVPGQYRSAWKLGKHQGKYDALVQAKPVDVYRDADRDGELDPDPATIQTGMFGINIHRASANHASTQVDKWSAGCQVIADPLHFDFLMALANRSAGIYGANFTYTLLLESDF